MLNVRLYLIIQLLFCITKLNAQAHYWQQQTNYRISVELNDKKHTLSGFLELTYFNHSPDTLKSIWIHLWSNAYRTDNTAFGDQRLENGKTDFYFSDESERGYINRLDFQINQKRAITKDHPQHIDIVEIILNQPLFPGENCLITTPFHIQLPLNFSRGGHIKKSYQITQWFPKAAVYDKEGWHPYPYLDQGEFYSNFGNYEVSITIPEKYTVLTSGILQKTENITGDFTKDSTAKKTLFFQQQNIHDFAWFADKNLQLLQDTMQLPSGKVINLTTAFNPKNAGIWENSISMMKRSLLFRTNLIGEYAYSHCTAVEAEMGIEGGMEYPCITSISPAKTENELEDVLEHEIGHNWFQGMIGSNERKHPWLDEGINTYYDNRYKETYKTKEELKVTNQIEEVLLSTLERTGKDQPLAISSELFTPLNYFLISYQKGAKFIKEIESFLGRESFDKAMQFYFEKWKFKHPTPTDFQQALELSSGKNLDSVFSLLTQTGSPEKKTKRSLQLGLMFKPNSNKKNTINLTPLPGYNSYDGFMVGAAISNYNLPPTKFQFLAAPLYGTKSKALNGAARLSYTFYPKKGAIENILLSTAWMNFTRSDFTDTAGTIYRTGFRKFVPGFRIIFKEDNIRSTRERSLQWKTFLIGEDNLRFSRDTFDNGNAYTKIKSEASFRYLNQLKFTIRDSRVLYPYRAELQAEQTKDFIRLAFTGNYYFNYNKKQGADVRFFAGKFLYLGNPDLSTRFRSSRFHLNLSGPRGFEDYTYSHYFIGRSEFEGWRSQQMAMRDGGFKVSTDLLATKTGKTDNWLIAMNFVSDIPDQLNILNVLPFKIPVKAYLDIGTYAEAWSPKSEESKILYNAGLQIGLLKQSIQVYFPLFYSRVYQDYFRSIYNEKRFARTISFVIDLQRLNWKSLDNQLPF